MDSSKLAGSYSSRYSLNPMGIALSFQQTAPRSNCKVSFQSSAVFDCQHLELLLVILQHPPNSGKYQHRNVPWVRGEGWVLLKHIIWEIRNICCSPPTHFRGSKTERWSSNANVASGICSNSKDRTVSWESCVPPSSERVYLWNSTLTHSAQREQPQNLA